jgi:hypothetical protein
MNLEGFWKKHIGVHILPHPIIGIAVGLYAERAQGEFTPPFLSLSIDLASS